MPINLVSLEKNHEKKYINFKKQITYEGETLHASDKRLRKTKKLNLHCEYWIKLFFLI